MKITKQKLGDLDRSYAASHLMVNNKPKVIIASEAYVDEGRPCYMYSGDDFTTKELVWQNEGGCMSILQVPDKEDEFFFIKDFYLKETPSRAKLMHAKYTDGKFYFTKLLDMPYLHRFGVTKIDETIYLILAVIADAKDNKEDWTRPGSIYAVELTKDFLNQKLNPVKIKTDLFRNHGFFHDNREGHNEIYFGSDQGIDKLYLTKGIENWKFERIFDKPTGEIAVIDLNNDGVDEILTIEPFHGDKIRLYEQKNKKLEKVYEYPNKIDFAHALVSTTFRGKNTFVCGVRRVEKELFYIQHNEIEGYKEVIIEKEVGPSNLDVVNLKDKDIIISANHSQNEAAIYIVED